MARTSGTEFDEKLSEVTECSICAEIFINPKLLPCVHTFCLHCLEKYGEDKNPGEKMACPLCRNEFVIPQQGFCILPNNFFIGKIVEIGKLATVRAKEEVCELCSEETAVAKMVCIDCEQKLCDRCSKSHTRIKHFQNHQVVELGSQLNFQELNLRNSYCEHHPKELVKMFCHEDNVAICLICCVESHQSHRCSNVDKAAGYFTEQLKDDLRKVADSRQECEEAFQKLENLKTELTEEVLKTEESIRKSGADLKELIDQHMEELVQNLRVVRDRNLKCFEMTKQDVGRFRVMIDSYQRYCNELLARGSSVDKCRAASQMHTRAIDLEKQPVNCGVDDFYCDQISFYSANLEILMKRHRISNFVGELRVTMSTDRIVRFQKRIFVSSPCEAVGLVEKCVPMDSGVVDVITKYMKDELRKIEAELKDSSGSIDTSKDEPGFVITGNETGVAKAVQDLLKLTDNIIVYDHDIDRPGIPAYFYSKHGKEVLRGIQFSHKVSIHLDDTHSRAEPQAVVVGGPEICRVEVRPGKFMILIRGDITKCNVDAIVNAANEDLKNIGGVAAAIAEAAGPELDEDCSRRNKIFGKVLPGKACVTRAGKLPCKKVIHAVGPRWSGGKKDEENILATAVDSSLNVANNEGLKSIAMLPISTEIFGFPLDRATDIILDAVKRYFCYNSSTTVCEVFFIDKDSRAVANIERKLKTIKADGSSEKSQERRRRILKTSEDPQALKRPPQNQEDHAGSILKTRTIADPRQQSEEQCEERQPQHLSRIVLSIHALSKKSIDDVLRDIEEVIKEYIIDKVLSSQQDQDNIAKLNPEQVKRIKAMADNFPVQIEVETGRLKRIRIRGPPMAVTSVMDQIHNIFQGEIMRNWVHWEFDGGNDFEKYPDEINVIIERAFRDRKPYAEWEEEIAKYRLTFQTMMEEFTTPTVKVRRVAKDSPF